MTTTHLLYLHGFRSSPRSSKAVLLAEHLRQHHPTLHWWCPLLPASPREAVQLLDRETRDWPAETSAVMGSSLGGFYADWLARRRGWRAVLLNPAVHPARDLAPYTGELTRWSEPHEAFHFHPRYLDELRALEQAPLEHAARHMAIIAQGDEVLDWREMARQHAAARLHLLEGGDHGLSDFADHLPEVLTFLGLTSQ